MNSRVVVLLALLVTVSCSSQGSGTPNPQPSPSSTVSSEQATPGGGDQVVSDDGNGRTLQLAVGHRLQVVLHSTYWTITGSSSPDILSLEAAPSFSPDVSCLPGIGCGTVAAAFRAERAGAADISAARTTCGEKLQCSTDQRSYRINVVVS